MRRILHWTREYQPRDFQKKTLVQPNEVIDRVIAHLRNGRKHEAYKGTAKCRVCQMPLGSTDQTDGTFIWPEQTEHYIIAHQVWTPEHELLANAVVYGVAPPPLPDASGTKSSDLMEDAPDSDFEFEIDSDLGFGTEDASEQTNSDDEVIILVDPASAPVAIDLPIEIGELDALFNGPIPSVRQIRPRVDAPATTPRALLSAPQDGPEARESGYNGHGHPEGDLVHQGTIEYGANSDPAAAIARAYPQAGAALAGEIVATARHIGAHPFDLANLIHFESAHTFRSDIQHPRSGATGLIQFYPGYTKKRLGVTTADLAKLTPVKQMEWVQTYFDKVRGKKPLDTTQKVAMAVFYPAAINWAPDKTFPSKVQSANKGIATPADYVRLMMRSAKLQPGVMPEPGVVEQISTWWASLWDAPKSTAPARAPSTPGQGAGTSWNIAGGLTARLSDGGQVYSPGSVPSGIYRLEQWNGNAWVPATQRALTLKPGFDYQLSSVQGELQWGERPQA